MASNVKWRIYYDDGSTFDSNDGDPDQAPGYGVICIVQPDPDVGRTVMRRFDWYYWNALQSQWWGSSDLFSVLDHVLHRTGFVDGRTICQARHAVDYADICQRAEADPDFPIRGGRSRSETPIGSAGR